MPMKTDPDYTLAATFTSRCAAARAHLRKEMEALGLHERDGWKIAEIVRRSADGGLELHMCPLHMRLKAPPGIECVVSIDPNEERVESECSPSPLVT